MSYRLLTKDSQDVRNHVCDADSYKTFKDIYYLTAECEGVAVTSTPNRELSLILASTELLTHLVAMTGTHSGRWGF